jgi:hypothetical protein
LENTCTRVEKLVEGEAQIFAKIPGDKGFQVKIVGFIAFLSTSFSGGLG